MGRVFGFLMIVLGVWIGMEFYNEGIDGAFGGVFAGMADPIQAQHQTGYEKEPTDDESEFETEPEYAAQPPTHGGSIVQRVRAAVTSDLESGAARRDDGMERN